MSSKGFSTISMMFDRRIKICYNLFEPRRLDSCKTSQKYFLWDREIYSFECVTSKPRKYLSNHKSLMLKLLPSVVLILLNSFQDFPGKGRLILNPNYQIYPTSHLGTHLRLFELPPVIMSFLDKNQDTSIMLLTYTSIL